MLDLSCGMILGGVEQWCFQTAQLWNKTHYQGEYLVPFFEPMLIQDDTFKTTMLGNNDIDANCRIAVFHAALKKFLNQKKSIILCNFPFEIFQAACFSKRSENAEIKILAVIHNDEEIYYRIYGIWKDEIDRCIVISKRMREKAILAGIPKRKIKLMGWYMSFPDMMHKYSKIDEPLQIGYAGRITLVQKRINLLEQIVQKMRKREIHFILQIAGSGDYEKELTDWIDKNKYDDVIYHGMISHEEIYAYWNRQDIYISVSEWEGHSISQTEAMAMGAVPVVTNTSGTEDDITNGKNGFIVDIDDIESMVDRLEQLYLDRELLRKMEETAKRTIRKKCDENKAELFWKNTFACL